LRLNPLHCGAVVASTRRTPRTRRPALGLNPLHCGAVVASRGWSPDPPPGGSVSQSPSLRGSGRFRRTMTATRRSPSGLNPLHCGAVVASNCPRRCSAAPRACLNPLHCGAVVASWFPLEPGASRECLNPLHCGAVVASSGGARACAGACSSQSPSLRGSGRFR